MIPPRYRREAAFHRAALLLGLEAGPATIAWAEAALAAVDHPPAGLIEVAMTPAADLSALRHALAPIEEVEPEGLTHALVDRAARDLNVGRRSLADTFTVLAQLRRGLTLAPDLEFRLAQFDNGYLLARARIAGDPVEAGTELEAWLGGFAGAEAAYFEGPIDHALKLPVDQAEAFLAALSRYLASPAVGPSAEPAQVWSEPGGATVRLYLNRAAWAAAEAAFAPLPAAAAEPADHRPDTARRVLNSRDRRALGQDEVALA